MNEIHGTATKSSAVAPAAAFRLITDIDRLPEWNRAIECVVDSAAETVPGTEWTVKMHPARGMSWLSRSRLEEIDDDLHRFRYRTWNADGNPSFSDWKWEVSSSETDTTVKVTWDVFLMTFDRKFFAGPIRRRQLRNEVAASLEALDQALRTT